METPKEKEKKKLIAPEEKAKQNMAKSLFGGPKGPSSKPAPSSTISKPPEQQKKKVEKVETIDLI
jgi:hypothetical protein